MTRPIRVYTASKLHWADLWCTLTETTGVDFVARWPVDHSGNVPDNDPKAARQFWTEDFEDVARCDVVLVYAAGGDVLRGALVEAGMGIALHKRVLVVDPDHNPSFGTWQYHPSVTRVRSLNEAWKLLLDWAQPVPFAERFPAYAGTEVRDAAYLARIGVKAEGSGWKGPGTEPHEYQPDTSQYGGDCAICGHTWQAHEAEPSPAAQPVVDNRPLGAIHNGRVLAERGEWQNVMHCFEAMALFIENASPPREEGGSRDQGVEEAARERALEEAVKRAQAVLADYIVPDSGITDTQVVIEMLGIFDDQAFVRLQRGF